MPIHIPGAKTPDCPLCHKPFEKARIGLNNVEYYFCKKDKIQIYTNDPMLERWSNIDPETGKAIECSNPNCGEFLNIFFRSDGYMKAVCPNKRCGAEIESKDMPDGSYIVEKGKGDQITRNKN